MKLERTFDGCEPRRYVTGPFSFVPAASRFFKGDSSSSSPQTATNQQVSTNAPGSPAIGAGASGNTTISAAPGSTVFNTTVPGGTPAVTNNGPGSATASPSTVTTVNNTSISNDPAAAIAAINANATLAGVAIGNATDEANTVINAGLQFINAQNSLLNNVVNNFGTVVSQAVAAFTNTAPAPATLATAPAYNYYAPAGNSETATNSNAINGSAANNPAPADTSSGATTGLTSGQTTAIVLGVVAVAVALYLVSR